MSDFHPEGEAPRFSENAPTVSMQAFLASLDADEVEQEAAASAALDVDRVAILAMNDESLLAELREQEETADRAGDAVAEWSWNPYFAGPDDPGLEEWQERSRQAHERLAFIEAEAARRGFAPAAPAVPEKARALSVAEVEEFLRRLGASD